MAKVIDRISVKAARAKEHIRAFDRGLRAFYDSKPYVIAIKEDEQTRKRTYYVAKADPIPDALTAIAADVIQNLIGQPANVPSIFVRDADKSPLHVGRELYIEPIDREIDPHRRFRTHVAFEHPQGFDGEPAIDTLQSMANLVDDVIAQLGPFLP